MEGSAMEQSFIPVFVSVRLIFSFIKQLWFQMQDANGNEYLNEYYSIPVGNNDGSGYDYPVSI